MIQLHGSPISNYYNKAKLALLEKGIPFEEVLIGTPTGGWERSPFSPLGKIPYMTTDEGGMCESQVILEYLEAKYPAPALLPKDPFEAAKVRQIVTFVDWHVEMAVRQLYGAAFFGAPPLSEANAARIRKDIEAKIAGLAKLVKFSPYIAGDTFTMADCAAFASFSVVAMATKTIYGEDLLTAGGIDHRAYGKFIGERPSAQKVVADRKAVQAKG